MAKEKIEELSTEVLLKRKKFSFFLIGVLIGVAIVLIVTNFLTGKMALLGIVGALFAVSAPMIVGIKKVNQELKKR